MKAKLIWTDPSTREDGSALPPSEIAEIRINQFVAGGSEVLGTVAAGVQTFTTLDLVPGSDHEFFVNAVDTTGNEGHNSNVAHVVVPAGPTSKPNPPADLTAEFVP